MRRTAVSVLLLLTVVLGGCLGGPGSASDTPVAEESPVVDGSPAHPPTQGSPGDTTADGTASPTDTSESTQTSTLTPNVYPPPSSDVVAYANLPAESQAAFDDASDGRVSFVPETRYIDGYTVDAAEPFRNHTFVHKNGTFHPITLDRDGELYASFWVEAHQVSGNVSGDVVSLSSLPGDARDEVRQAVENGTYHAPLGKWDSTPDLLGDAEYVRYDGRTYRLEYVIGDYWAETLTVGYPGTYSSD